MGEHGKKLPPRDTQELLKFMYIPKASLTPSTSLVEDIARLFDAYGQLNKYHRKTNYKPKYTL